MRLVKVILKIFLVLALAGVGWWFYDNRAEVGILRPYLSEQTLTSQSKLKEPLPPETGQVSRTFSWDYAGQQYTIQQNLYTSTFDFYQNQSKAFEYWGELPDNWEEEYYATFVTPAEGDSSVKGLAKTLSDLGKRKGFSQDQIVELAVSFVQALEYDESKARAILTRPEGAEKPRFPYEVLYEQTGVCSDKSFLLVAILRELGYGAALFEYEAENHMAVGITCPVQYALAGSGYCYVETTSTGHKIGIVPYLNPGSNQAVERPQMGHFNESGQEENFKKPQNLRVFQATKGKTYQGVAQTLATMGQIQNLEQKIEKQKQQLKKDRDKVGQYTDEFASMAKKMEKYRDQKKFEEYNGLVDKHNKLVEDYKEFMQDYNERVSDYNKEIDKYNALVEQFNS